jgi:succinate dehydrogenase/fumarate reductase cytochrome b subunit
MRMTRRNVTLTRALRYKGQGPMLTFILHRLGGLGMALFVTIHILSSYLGGTWGLYLNGLYESWGFQIVIFFFVMFHIINGLRITVFDLWPSLLVYEREAVWLEWPVFLATYGFAVLVIIRAGLGS